MTEIRSASAFSVCRDEESPQQVLLYLFDGDARPFAGIALDIASAMTLNERLTATIRRALAERQAGTSPSAVLN